MSRVERIRAALRSRKRQTATVRELVEAVGGTTSASGVLSALRVLERRGELVLRRVRQRVLCRDGYVRTLEMYVARWLA